MDESRMNASLSTLRGHYYWLFPSVIISLSPSPLFVRSHYWVKKRESFAPTVYSKREEGGKMYSFVVLFSGMVVLPF